MIALVKMLVFAAGTMLATSAFAQSAREVRGPLARTRQLINRRLDHLGWETQRVAHIA